MMITTHNFEEAHSHLSAAILHLSQEAKNPRLAGQWLDSVQVALKKAKEAREHLEAIE